MTRKTPIGKAVSMPALILAGLFLLANLFAPAGLAVDLFDLDADTGPPPPGILADGGDRDPGPSAEPLLAGPLVYETSHDRPTALIRLPLVRQARDNTCGVACVQSLLRYAGPEFDLREDLLIPKVGTDESGTPVDGMVNFLNRVRLRGDTVAGEGDDAGTPIFTAEFAENLTVEDLIRHIDQGRPVICLFQAWSENAEGQYEIERDYRRIWASGHYAIAVGYDARRLYFMDPSTMGSYTYIPRDEFTARWHGVGDITEEGVERLERAGIIVTIPKPGYAPEEFFKIL